MKTTYLLLLASVALVCSCASVGKNFDSTKVSQIIKGQTTEAELVKMFGPPSQRAINSESGTALTWLYSEARVKGESFIPIAGAFVGGATSRTKTLIVSLDRAGKVSSYTYSGGGFESAGATQPDPENSAGRAAQLKSPKEQ